VHLAQDVSFRRGAVAARQLLQPERIPHLTREEIAEFLQNTNAWNGVRGKQQFWRRLFGTQNERLPALRETLADLVRRAELGLTAADFNSLLTARSGIGPAYLSEILTLRFPERYWLWNKQVRDFLAAQQVDLKAELPRGKKGDAGEEYLAAGRHIADVRRALTAAAGRPMDYLLTDIFVYWVNQAEETGPEPRLALSDLSAATFLPPAFLEGVATLLRDKKQLVFYGPPGTGKTFVARQFARYWVDAAPDAGGAVQVVQFHPSYAYEEFVEGIRPQSVEGTDGRCELSYPVKKGLFRHLCDEARGHPNRYYVLILDEINRGELPRILGELLYLLEYRDQTVTLPYSGEPFAIPPNLYLIGTMNTADRSIALVDHALRRRFHFVALKPDPEIVRAYFESNGQPAMTWTADLLERVNRKLEQDGVEWHRHIGHSHFMCRDLDEVRLRLIWAHSVLPTLEEYFYRQPDVVRAYTLDALKEELGLA
jgi:hypothetical protein